MVSMVNKKYIKYSLIVSCMLIAALFFSILEIMYLSEKNGNPAMVISTFDYLACAQNSIVAGINFYIFAVVIALETVLLTDNDYSYNAIIRYGRSNLFYRQVVKIILTALCFSSIFFWINFTMSLDKSVVFYNWSDINSYLFYTKKYFVEINPYLLMFLIWLQIFMYIVSTELLYLLIKWIFWRGKEAFIMIVWLIFLIIERLTGRMIPVVNAATLHENMVEQTFFITIILISMKLILLKTVIKKRDL